MSEAKGESPGESQPGLRERGLPQPEPWLRGDLLEVPAVARAVLHALQLAREDIDRWCGSLSGAELHARPFDLPSIAFHLCHVVRSLDRLLTYAEGDALSEKQIAGLRSEMDSGTERSAIFADFHEGLAAAGRRVRSLATGDMEGKRGVGKKQLPASAGGLMVHLADHTQRHVGQAITTAKVILAQRDSDE